MTFVNPEPLAPFADVIAAGEGEVLVPGLRRAVSPPRPIAPTCCACSPRERGFYIPSFYEPQYAADGTLAGYTVRAGVDAPLPVRKAALKTTDALDPPATSIFTPDTEFGSRFLVEVVRGCANLCRFCWAGYNYLPVRAFPADRILELARAARPHSQPRRPRVDRALRSPGHRAHSRPPARDGLRDQPGVAAPRRSDRADRPRPARRAASGRSRSRRRPAPIGCAA